MILNIKNYGNLIEQKTEDLKEMEGMKCLLKSVVSVALMFSVANTEAANLELFKTVESVVNLDKSVVRTIDALEDDGFVEVNREFQQIYYVMECSNDCAVGVYNIVMRSPTTGEYSLKRTYAYINVNIYSKYETGLYYVDSIKVEEMIVN